MRGRARAPAISPSRLPLAAATPRRSPELLRDTPSAFHSRRQFCQRCLPSAASSSRGVPGPGDGPRLVPRSRCCSRRVLWAVAVVAAPIAHAHCILVSPAVFASAVVYGVGGVVCHQRPDRSFHTGGLRWPVCARCAGLYVSAGAGALVAAPQRPGGWRTVRGRGRGLPMLLSPPRLRRPAGWPNGRGCSRRAMRACGAGGAARSRGGRADGVRVAIGRAGRATEVD